MKTTMAIWSNKAKLTLARSMAWGHIKSLPIGSLRVDGLKGRPSIIDLLPKIDMNNRLRPMTPPNTIAADDNVDRDDQSDAGVSQLTDTSAVLQISTFKRKKPKVRKDRARTIRRKIKRKSQKKRSKYNL
jgi:hypothetical protein